jgi:hypothetical protein
MQINWQGGFLQVRAGAPALTAIKAGRQGLQQTERL